MYQVPIDKLKKFKVGVVYLFGSAVEKLDSKLSDIDIGIVFTDPAILKDSLKLYTQLSDIFYESLKPKREIDVVFLQQASLSLQVNAINKGKILYEISSEFRANYEERVLNEYLDFKSVNDYIHKIAIQAFK
jgi:predicted nucleotidyltransferase